MRTPIVPLGHGGGGCSLCREREAIRNWSLAAIREQILHKLNLQHPPNITGRHVPKYETLQSFFEPMQGDDPRAGPAAGSVFRAREDDEDDYHAKTERIIAFPQSHSNKVRHGLQGHNVLHFRFSPKVMQSQVARASLWVYLRGTGRPHHHRYHAHHFEDEDGEDEEREDRTPPTVLVHVMRLRGRGSGADGPALELEAMTKVPQPDNDGLWVEVDIKKMVEDWFRRPRDIQGLVVQAEAGGRQLVNSDTNDEDNPKMPFIEVYLKEGRKRRVRRAPSLNCDENSEESRCCRYPLVVDFERFGWDFIIFPKRYNAYYCSGECPYVYLQEYPHTALMHLANNKTGPCCAPRKMLSMNMLYFDNDLNVVFGVLPNMVVDRCGCF